MISSSAAIVSAIAPLITSQLQLSIPTTVSSAAWVPTATVAAAPSTSAGWIRCQPPTTASASATPPYTNRCGAFPVTIRSAKASTPAMPSGTPMANQPVRVSRRSRGVPAPPVPDARIATPMPIRTGYR